MTPSIMENRAAEHKKPFSTREHEILTLLGQGRTTKDVAAELVLEISTVNGYVRDLYQRLGLTDRLQLGIWIGLNLSPAPIQ